MIGINRRGWNRRRIIATRMPMVMMIMGVVIAIIGVIIIVGIISIVVIIVVGIAIGVRGIHRSVTIRTRNGIRSGIIVVQVTAP